MEGVTYPCVHGIWRWWAPPLERTKLGTMALAGSYGGAVLGMPVSGEIFSFVFSCQSVSQAILPSGSGGTLRSTLMGWLVSSGTDSGFGSPSRNPQSTLPYLQGNSSTSRSHLATPRPKPLPSSRPPGPGSSPACLSMPSSLPTLPVAGPSTCSSSRSQSTSRRGST